LEAVPVLLAGLTHPDFMWRGRCAEAIIRIGLPCLPLLRQTVVQGGVMVSGEAVPLTLNGWQDLLRIIERLEDSVER
jgi:hypothetical protein